LPPQQLSNDEVIARLQRMAESGDAAGIAALLASGVVEDVNASTPGSFSPLMNAASNNHTECCRLLLDAGADPLAEYLSTTVSALSVATRTGSKDAARLLVSRIPDVELLTAGTHGFAPIQAVAVVGDAERLRAALRDVSPEGVEPAVGAGRRWPSEIGSDIARGGSMECFDVAEAGGVDMWARPAEVLHAAARGDGGAMTRRVLEVALGGGWLTDADMAAAVTEACVEGSARAMSAMLAAGVDACWPLDEPRRTPLMIAARYRKPAAVRLLLGRGAMPSIDAVDYKGRTAAMHACQAGCAESLVLLLDAGASAEPVAAGAGDFNGRTCLIRACRFGHMDVVRVLQERGVGGTVHDVDEGSRTALHLAAEEGREEAIGLLIAHGVPVDVRSETGQTALLEMLCFGIVNELRITTVLLEAGASPEAKDNTGRTPLSYAAANGKEDVVALLRWRPISSDGLHDASQLALKGGHDSLASRLATAARWARRLRLLTWRRAAQAAME